MSASSSIEVPRPLAVLGINWINPVAPENLFLAFGLKPDSAFIIAIKS